MNAANYRPTSRKIAVSGISLNRHNEDVFDGFIYVRGKAVDGVWFENCTVHSVQYQPVNHGCSSLAVTLE